MMAIARPKNAPPIASNNLMFFTLRVRMMEMLKNRMNVSTGYIPFGIVIVGNTKPTACFNGYQKLDSTICQ